ncbi:MAG: arabinogalactan endo-1,4-beta-galactosidase, partial [Armatimonadota bacterium]|nr:arabinogalactan endo-1,4-beta-galactosidase [Armatimonadota bacterium]
NTPVQNQEFLTGGDISLLTKIEQAGGVYRDDGQPRDLLDIFKARGCNLMRLRLWVQPSGQKDQVCDLAYTLALAQRIKRAGFKLLLDFHYSDTWADPAHQTKPAAWRDLPFDALRQQVYDYSRDTIAAFKAADALPDMVQVGNEVQGGMLWPDGKSHGSDGAFERFATLVKAGIEGVQAGAGGVPVPIVMHTERGGDPGGTQWFVENLIQHGVAFDVIGLSYYPVWHGPLSKLQANLKSAATRFHKPIIVVEAGYPWKGGNLNDKKAPMAYPATPDGQRQFLTDVIEAVRQTPEGLGRGVLWWAPEWIPTKEMGGGWSPRTLFDDDGNALPALDALGQIGQLPEQK